MQVRQTSLTDMSKLGPAVAELAAFKPDVVLAFAAPGWFAQPDFGQQLQQGLAEAHRCGCSTAGEISAAGVADSSCVLTGLKFSGGHGRLSSTETSGLTDSRAAGERLAAQLELPAPTTVLVFAPGVHINGSALIEGLLAGLPPGCRVVGGLAGDGTAFKRTWTLCDTGVSSRAVVAYALPPSVDTHSGSMGGWKPFGPALKVTRAAGSLLLELDGEPALTVYKRFLGTFARDLPASGLLFPFEVLREDQGSTGIIRTILSVSESDSSLALAGGVETNGFVRLMHASHDALVDGAGRAAVAVHGETPGTDAERFALLVSCVGRKLVLGRRVEDEVKAVSQRLGAGVTLAGFYSYGEIGPAGAAGPCHLLNQTMTVVELAEP